MVFKFKKKRYIEHIKMRKLIDKKKQRINTKDKLLFLMLEKYTLFSNVN